LAFHLYPQLISQLFNVEEFGPPQSVTSASTWPWVAHAVSGLVRATTDLVGPRPIQTRFRFGFGRQALTSPHTANSPDHSSIGTPSRYRDESRQHASTACRHTVSVSISLPSRGAFHLSLTVLVHYRSLEVFSLRQWSAGFPTLETFRVVLEDCDRRLIAFAYWAVTIYGWPFQAHSANDQFSGTPLWIGRSTVAPHNSSSATPAGYHAEKVWALPVSLATTQGIVSVPRGTEMFQFPRCPPRTL
jgi:hypothetical protein